MGILLEGFTLFSLIGHFLTVMVTMFGCTRVATRLLYMFSNNLLVTVYFPKPWSWVSHGRGLSMVVGYPPIRRIILWYWQQRTSEVGYRMAIMPRCMLYGCWWYLLSAFPLALLKSVRLLRKA
jgi:hypothetical protein